MQTTTDVLCSIDVLGVSSAMTDTYAILLCVKATGIAEKRQPMGVLLYGRRSPNLDRRPRLIACSVPVA